MRPMPILCAMLINGVFGLVANASRSVIEGL